MLLILIRGSPPLGLLELSAFHGSHTSKAPTTPFPTHSLTLLAHLLQRTSKSSLWSIPAGSSESQQNLEAVGKDVQSQLRHKTLQRVPWFVFLSSLVDVLLFFLAPPSVFVELGFWHLHWLFSGILTSIVGAFLGMCAFTTTEGYMPSRRECVAWLMFSFLIPCVSLDSYSWVRLTSNFSPLCVRCIGHLHCYGSGITSNVGAWGVLSHMHKLQVK